VQYQEIVDLDWDVLVILDACRFDVFREVIGDFFDGETEVRLSRGSTTSEWLHNTFEKPLKGVTYVSANPFVNSKGMPLNKTCTKCCVHWDPTKYFDVIVDVWDDGWESSLGTVLPESVNHAFARVIDDNRKIVHYMQPHGPYISFGHGSWKGARDRTMGLLEKRAPPGRFKLVRDKLISYAPVKRIWDVKELLGLPGELAVEIGYRKKGDVMYFYRDNLKKALTSVSKLLRLCSGKVVITSDHGEAFGEKGVWGHPYGSHLEVLRKVPWFELEV